MKSTGIVRKVDNLGRVVLPKELRRTMHLDTGDEFEVFVDEDSIILKKYDLSCIFCDEKNDLIRYKDKYWICCECIKDVASLKD